jgi:hypothetical protein
MSGGAREEEDKEKTDERLKQGSDPLFTGRPDAL